MHCQPSQAACICQAWNLLACTNSPAVKDASCDLQPASIDAQIGSLPCHVIALSRHGLFRYLIIMSLWLYSSDEHSFHVKASFSMLQPGQIFMPCTLSLLLLLCCSTCGSAVVISPLRCLFAAPLNAQCCLYISKQMTSVQCSW